MRSRCDGVSTIDLLLTVVLIAALAVVGVRHFTGERRNVDAGALQAQLSSSAQTLLQHAFQGDGLDSTPMPALVGATHNGACPQQNCAEIWVKDVRWAPEADGLTVVGDGQIALRVADPESAAAQGREATLVGCRDGYFESGAALCMEITLDPFAAGGGAELHRYCLSACGSRPQGGLSNPIAERAGGWPPTPTPTLG